MKVRYRNAYADVSHITAFSDRIAEIANRAWTGYLVDDDLAWRKKYYGKLATSEHATSFFGIIEKYAEGSYTGDVGFAVAFPVQNSIAQLMLNGSLSQLLLEPEHFDVRPDEANYTYHYIQSVYVDKSERSSVNGNLHKSLIRKLLRSQGCGSNNANYRIWMQTNFERGIILAKAFDFYELDKLSADKGRQFSFDSKYDVTPTSRLHRLLTKSIPSRYHGLGSP